MRCLNFSIMKDSFPPGRPILEKMCGFLQPKNHNEFPMKLHEESITVIIINHVIGYTSTFKLTNITVHLALTVMIVSDMGKLPAVQSHLGCHAQSMCVVQKKFPSSRSLSCWILGHLLLALLLVPVHGSRTRHLPLFLVYLYRHA